jgi:uncharacterized membrane protein
MTAAGWILIILLMIPGVLVCWALFFKSGELQRSKARLRVLRPTARRHTWTMFLVFTVVATALGAAVVWAFSTNHAVLVLAILVGLVVLNGIVTPLLRARKIHRKSASASSEAKKPQ